MMRADRAPNRRRWVFLALSCPGQSGRFLAGRPITREAGKFVSQCARGRVGSERLAIGMHSNTQPPRVRHRSDPETNVALDRRHGPSVLQRCPADRQGPIRAADIGHEQRDEPLPPRKPSEQPRSPAGTRELVRPLSAGLGLRRPRDRRNARKPHAGVRHPHRQRHQHHPHRIARRATLRQRHRNTRRQHPRHRLPPGTQPHLGTHHHRRQQRIIDRRARSTRRPSERP